MVPLVPAEELAALIRQSFCNSDAKAVILSHGGHEGTSYGSNTVQTWQMPCLKKSQSGKARSLLSAEKGTNATKARLRPGIFPISMIRKHIKK